MRALILSAVGLLAVLSAASVLLPGCSSGGTSERLMVSVDGSSTVFPITEAVAEEFQKEHPNVRVTVGISGTGGGFKKFTKGEIDINDASRPIKGKEITKAEEEKVEFIEIPVAFDGISVVAHPKNSFLNDITAEELKKIWEPGSQVKTWSQIRSSWPNEEIKLYGPGTDSGTFDYFTEAINGESQACRKDFTASEDDNVLVRGVSNDQHSLGFFGFAYYKENADKLKVVPVNGGDGAVAPSMESINKGTYQPLSRPIFIYAAASAGVRPCFSRRAPSTSA
ncbi:MAG: PstS family phosphate ABC transporter substrate-binding protein, partial [Planctomycetota bacterium]